MSKKLILAASVFLVAALCLPALTTARTAADISKFDDGGSLSAAAPAHCLTAHRIGRIVLGVSNNGTIGNNYASGSSSDCFTGQAVPSCEFPKASGVEYLFGGAFWIGAVVGRDTLVSVGADGWSSTQSEMLPDEPPFGDMIKRSIIDPSNPEYVGAISEEDYIATYSDTYTTGVPADWSGRAHRALNIQVTQSSYAWSYSYAEDIILFDYKIRNIGTRKIEKAYMGLYIDADVCFDCTNTNGFADDLCGFVRSLPAFCSTCEYEDEVNIAWIADNDGDPGSNGPTPHVTATRIVRTPAEELDVSFNWWIGNGNASLDFGPREKANVGRLQEDFRDYGTGGLGTPEGDRNKYYVLSNQEFDYDQAFTAVIQPTDTLWLAPGSDAAQFATGYDTRYLLSFGPFDINEGEVLPLSFAYFAGENFHQVIGNSDNLPNDPQAYYDNLNFDSLGLNSRWASWMYDNPGVDTDGDGDFGELYVCVLESTLVDSFPEIDGQGQTTWVKTYDPTLADSCFIQGDGVPDFRGASPPPAPASWTSELGISALRVRPEEGKLTIVWNGLRSETARDAFSGVADFEGYRVYVSSFDSLRDSYSLIASYDVEDYNKWVWNPDRSGGAGFELLDIPFSVAELRALYGDNDPNWDPLDFSSPSSRYTHPIYADSTFYFQEQDFNVSDLGGLDSTSLNDDTPIELVYPNQPFPSTLDPNEADSSELTEEGFFKYYEYKLVMDNLLSSIDYLVSVTAFDFGSPSSGLPSLESPVDFSPVRAFAQASASQVEQGGLNVYVYPNPYRIDGKYASRGFEDAPSATTNAERQRRVHFANLPERCTIRIFSLDGDLIREWEHDMPGSDPTSGHDYWDLITRNTQQVVSGLYYWTVEDTEGNVQIGKLVIIM